jgi:hypothetical protein
MKDFFISYNHADRSWSEWIAWQLEEKKYTIIIQDWDFQPGLQLYFGDGPGSQRS